MNGDNALQRELLEEKASALARIGGVLQNTIERLHGIRRQLESASTSAGLSRRPIGCC
jgi:hypothetical protein